MLLDRNLFTFDEATFDKQWKQCNADERRSIAHGRGSKQIHEYDKEHWSTTGYLMNLSMKKDHASDYLEYELKNLSS